MEAQTTGNERRSPAVCGSRKTFRALFHLPLILLCAYLAACSPNEEEPLLTGSVYLVGSWNYWAGDRISAVAEVENAPEGSEILFQWWRRTSDAADEKIAGAQSSEYTLTQGDVGSLVYVTVRCAGLQGNITSRPVGPVIPRPQPPAVSAWPPVAW
jgi:hypothetical protein